MDASPSYMIAISLMARISKANLPFGSPKKFEMLEPCCQSCLNGFHHQEIKLQLFLNILIRT